LPIGNAEVGRLRSSITKGTLLCLGHEARKSWPDHLPFGGILGGPYAMFLPEVNEFEIWPRAMIMIENKRNGEENNYPCLFSSWSLRIEKPKAHSPNRGRQPF
jgi:hypothetical protein